MQSCVVFMVFGVCFIVLFSYLQVQLFFWLRYFCWKVFQVIVVLGWENGGDVVIDDGMVESFFVR